ncbi:hypothetical protein DB30_06392 [Enhygromyxa salina]|uniref:Uncharacterized protein n=1 Tax=Enhygromyxa salina TaxID=215803 RepID=A0A0C2CUK7_9BACT|nr:hypothetical protein DB30_06392 [Enhygromyxa salina]
MTPTYAFALRRSLAALAPTGLAVRGGMIGPLGGGSRSAGGTVLSSATYAFALRRSLAALAPTGLAVRGGIIAPWKP